MTELLICSAIVLVALTGEYIRWLNRPDAEYPVWRSILWWAVGCIGYMVWLGIGPIAVGVLLITFNTILGMLIIPQFIDFAIWWRSEQNAAATLRRVLAAFAHECPDPDYGDLERWCERYPQFEHHLTIAAIARNIELMPELEPLQQGV